MTGYVLLEDGARFDGDLVGALNDVTGEVVFTTGMAGYQESMTDPSFHAQIITFTYPMIGNYGVSAEGMESEPSKPKTACWCNRPGKALVWPWKSWSKGTSGSSTTWPSSLSKTPMKRPTSRRKC